MLVWLFYSLNIRRLMFKSEQTFQCQFVCNFILFFFSINFCNFILFSINFYHKTITNVHKIHFQIQSNTLLTRTPANPFGARNLSHSRATSLNFHSNRCTMAFLHGTVLGFFWAWMFATENKSHTRCSSSILQDVVPTHW